MNNAQEIISQAKKVIEGWENIKALQIEEAGTYSKGIDSSIQNAKEIIEKYDK